MSYSSATKYIMSRQSPNAGYANDGEDKSKSDIKERKKKREMNEEKLMRQSV